MMKSKHPHRLPVCIICGATASVLSVEHVLPKGRGGTDNPENLFYVCARCNFGIDGLPGVVFERLLASLLRASPAFHDVVLEGRVGTTKVIADVLAKRVGSGEQLIIECKNFSTLTGPRLESAVKQLTEYVRAAGFGRGVLAFPGLADERALASVREHGIELWDLKRLGETFRTEVGKLSDPYFRALFESVQEQEGIEEKLIRQLKECPPGREAWQQYQRLIGRILTHLFCPPLNSSLDENSDWSNTNRRDFIFPNYAPDGFWSFMRGRYAADYVVVDAKNGKTRVNKTSVLQLANYLKDHGVGRFGLIMGREGFDKSAMITMREQWAIHGKMIVILNDRDVEDMLLSKAALGDPSTVIGEKVQCFRLQM